MAKQLSIDELPESAMDRYIRSHWAASGHQIPFAQFKTEWSLAYARDCAQRDTDHPVEFDKTIHLDQYQSVTLFKRVGEDWLCSFNDMAPNGGGGKISLIEALKMVIEKVPNV